MILRSRPDVVTTWDDTEVPLTIDEPHDPIGPDANSIGHVADAASVGSGQQNHNGFRCSEKVFLPLSAADYLALLDWTARQLADGKLGSTPHNALPIFERLSIDRKFGANSWADSVACSGTLLDGL